MRHLLLLIILSLCGSITTQASHHSQDSAYVKMTLHYFDLYQQGKDEKAYYKAAKQMKDYLLEHNDKELYYIIRSHEVIFDANLGKTYRALQKVNTILKDIEQEKNKDSYVQLINYTLGSIYHLRGNYRLAEYYYKKANEKCAPTDSPSRMNIYSQMAELKLVGSPKEADQWIEKLGDLTRASHNPEYHKAYLMLKGKLYFYHKDRWRFDEIYREFFSIQRKHPEFSNDGVALMKAMNLAFSGYYQSALQLINADNNEIEALDKPGLRIQIYKMMDRYDLALDEFSKIKVRRDSLDTDMLFDSMTEIDTQMSIYNRTKNMAEKNRKMLIASLFTICVMLTLALISIIYHHLIRRRYQKTIEQKNRELSVALEQATESDRMKTAFIEHVSHEIRTPLNIITGYAQLIGNPEYEISPEEHTEMVNSINENSNMITTIFNELLDIAQYSSNKKFVCEDMVNVGSLLKTIIGDAEEKNKRRLQLIAENTEPDDFTIKTNKIALCRVLSQLMDNAIKFTKSGSVTLAFHADKASKTLQFTVTDTGIGIPLAHQEKVFDRFYKVDMFRQGFGLGLPICRKVSELLGGTIVVDKDYVDGTRFILTLPMQ